MNNTEKGRSQEKRACSYLKDKGYEILNRNFYSRYGEIDIIAKQQQTIVFIEVKYRESTRLTTPEEAVDYKKRRRIIKTADYYRLKNQIRDDVSCRFDVISMTQKNIVHHTNAFGYDGRNLA
jgi:putative endonuclease